MEGKSAIDSRTKENYNDWEREIIERKRPRVKEGEKEKIHIEVRELDRYVHMKIQTQGGEIHRGYTFDKSI